MWPILGVNDVIASNLFKNFFASDEYKTGIPKEDSVEPLPFELNSEIILPDPINFKAWLNRAHDSIQAKGAEPVFGTSNQMSTTIYGPGEHEFGLSTGQQWLYQIVSHPFSSQFLPNKFRSQFSQSFFSNPFLGRNIENSGFWT